jgi:hypothetical protein
VSKGIDFLFAYWGVVIGFIVGLVLLIVVGGIRVLI